MKNRMYCCKQFKILPRDPIGQKLDQLAANQSMHLARLLNREK